MATISAKIVLDSSQFRRALDAVKTQTLKAGVELGALGKSGLVAGQGVAVGALALGAVAVGKNSKAFAAVRAASISCGVAVAGIGKALDVTAGHFGGLFKSSRTAFSGIVSAAAGLKSVFSLGLGKASLGLLGPDLQKAGAGIRGVFGSLRGVFSSLGGVAASGIKGIAAGLKYVAVVAKGVAANVGNSLLSISKFGLKGIAIIGAGVAAIGGLAAHGIHAALGAGADLDRLSARTGAPKKDLLILSQAFKDVGLSSDQVGPAVNRLQKALTGVNAEGQPTNKMFQRLGLDMEALKQLTPTQQFQKVGAAIANLKDPAERAGAAMAIFGKSGGELNQLFSNPEAINNAQKVLGGQADILAKNSARFEKVHTGLSNIGIKVRGFFVGVAEALLPKLEALVDWLNQLDLSKIGEKLGGYLSSGINILVNAFKTGKFGELLGLSLKTGLATAGDYLIGVFQVAINILGEAIGLIFSGDFWSALVNGFYGVSLKIMAFFMAAFEKPITWGAAALEIAFEGAMKVWFTLKDFFVDVANFFIAAIRTGIQKVIALLPKKLQPKDFKAQSFEQNLAEEKRLHPHTGDNFHVSTWDEAMANAKSSVPELAKTTNGAADEFLKAAGASLGSLGTKIAEIFGRNIKAFKSGDLFGSKDLQAQLVELAKSLNIPIETVKKTAEKVAITAQEGELADPEAKEKKTGHHAVKEADQFARIGLFASAQGANATLNYNQKIASHTGKMVALLAKMAGGTAAIPQPARAG